MICANEQPNKTLIKYLCSLKAFIWAVKLAEVLHCQQTFHPSGSCSYVNKYRFSIVHLSPQYNIGQSCRTERQTSGWSSPTRQGPSLNTAELFHQYYIAHQASNTNTPRQLPRCTTSTYLPSRCHSQCYCHPSMTDSSV